MSMFIRELAQQTGVSTKTIRFYESIGLLPSPTRADNNYRQYNRGDVERLRFIAAARGLGFSLDDIGEFLIARNNGALPCQRVVDSLDSRLADIDRRLADLLALRETLGQIQREAKNLPPGKVCNEACVGYLLTVNRDNGQITIEQEVTAHA
jgi:DNA-binding transcriptional MerR regulator